MDNKMVYVTFFRYFPHEISNKLIGVELVNPQSAFNCAINPINPFSHCLHALVHELGLLHEAGSKGSFLHSGTRAADIKVDLIIPILNSDLGSIGQLGGI